MKKLFSILLLLVMILSLERFAGATEPDYKTGTPWPDVDLEGVVTEDMEASIKDNFVLAVNKEKILATKIPEGYSCGGTITDLELKQTEDLKKLFMGKAPKDHDSKLAYNLFQLMMDWNSRNAQGVAPLKKVTDTIEAINTIDALNAYFLKTPVEDQLAMLWACESSADFINSSRHVMTIGYCSLLLEDSAEYSNLTDYGALKKKAVSDLARKMLIKLGYTEKEALQKIENCFALETMLSPTIFTNEQQNSPDFYSRINNYYTYKKLTELQGNVPVLQMLKHIGYPNAKEYVVMSPDFLTKLNGLYTQENLPLLKDYLIVHSLVASADNLDRECYEWHYAYMNEINGASGMLPDEEVFASDVAEILEWPVARFYSETYLKQADKDRISKLVDKIVDAYHGVINEADFLSDATKLKAIEKLDAMDKRVLFPDNWKIYECTNLNFASTQEGGTLWQAMRNIKAYNLAKNVKKYSKPVNKQEWCMTPHTVNCAYDMQTNAIHIMGAFSQGAMYNSDMGDEELLAKLGWVIGHEISHAFDSTGAQFDKYGNMANWWTDEDYAAFLVRNDKMTAYYDNMHPWEGQNFYGSIMTGEAGADMAGLKVILSIAEEKENFDYDKFFRAFAEVWLTKATLEDTYAQINDVHPMGYLRINCTLQQFDKFLNFYGIKEGDGMYLAPKDRVIIW